MKLETNIEKYQPAYISEYPQFDEVADKQMDIFWPHKEIAVEKDKQDLLTCMTDSERHGTITALKLFTKYELFVGTDYWAGVVMKKFKRKEIQRVGACFSHVELNSHAPFYDKINKELGLSTVEFYNSYVEDEELRDRVEFIEKLVSCDDIALSLAGFSMVEGAILYSSFAYLKHFQSKGKNKLANVCRGINMSVTDENLHSITGAALCNIVVKEREYSEEEYKCFVQRVVEMAKVLYAHECRIIDMLFEHGAPTGISSDDMKVFVQSRINTCLQQLNIEKLFTIESNPIAEWFYKGINNFQYNDFFSGIGREYQRNFSEDDFVWEAKK